jgi:type II secretory pathway component PulF
LAVAIGKQMPLGPVATAFANEQEGAFAARAAALAEQFNRGVPLDEALRSARRTLPPESALAAALGLETGDLAGALEATTYASVFDRTWLQPAVTRLVYVFLVVCALSAALSFVQIKISPSWKMIFSDFDVPLPPSLALSNTLPDAPLPDSWVDWMIFQVPPGFMPNFVITVWLTFLVFVFILVMLVAGIFVWLQWRGTLSPFMPGLRRVVNWVDMAQLLRILALATRHNRPLVRTLSAIMRLHPKWSVRRRVRRVMHDIDNGLPWQDSFRRRGLLSSTDAAILSAAGQSGNLPWAMREMADHFERKANYRMQGAVQMISPVLLLPIALLTGVICVAYFVPLANLIEHLS